jgi:hypothetical protein
LSNLSGQQLVCKPAVLKLHEDGEDNFFQCIVPQTDQFPITRRNYASLLSVQLDYSYVQVDTWDLKIKNGDADNFDIGGITTGCKNYEMPTVKNGQNTCVSICEYCSYPANVNSPNCTKNKPTNFVGWQNNFTCGCSQEKCNVLSKDGKCIFGYCPGSNYCCTTNVCLNAQDGTECGDNSVCVKNVCEKSISECDWLKGVEGKSCMNQTKCASGTIETGLCPGAVTNVCCNPMTSTNCQGKEDGTLCGTNNAQVCIKGACSTTTHCTFAWGEYGFSCNANSQCRTDNQRLSGYCPTGTDFCCINFACLNKTDGTDCGDNHVCKAGICSTKSSKCEFTYSTSGRTCMNQSECATQTIIQNVCPAGTGVCCNQKDVNSCVGKIDGTPCGSTNTMVCRGEICVDTAMPI